jgi:DnaJ family protein C protein 28
MTARRERKDWESWIDEQIREAQEKGQFDNLPGKGKPLDLTSNAYAGDRELAYKILSEAGYAPEWIELDKAIRNRLSQARAALVRAWAWYQESAGGTGDAAGLAAAASSRRRPRRLPVERERAVALAAWQAAEGRFREEVAAINAQITELNLKVPGPNFQRNKLDAGREVRALTGGPKEGTA